MQWYPGLQTLKLILRRPQLLIFGSLRRSITDFRFRSCRGFDPPKSWFMGTCPMDRRLVLLPFLCLFSVWSFSTLVFSSEPLFYESFDETFQGRWSLSDKEDYKGVWKHAKSEGHEDYGLLVSEPARKYALVKEASEAIVTADGTVILQYEVRLQNGLECGGAYLKFLRTQEAGWKPQAFDNESPYSIMFGPDKCGATNKIHFIFNHKNPKTGEYVEHHLKFPPTVPYDKLTHVYTAILEPNNDLRILVDGEEKKKANLLSAEHFEPPVIPPKEIPDPEDKKPEDWDERAKIPDPDAKKPDDWDEDAPMEILDLEAEKPEGWLDDEPEDVDDPEATKPEDWDDEEDGEWEAPKIPNPKCDEAPGCGEWKRPMKRNPDYKGKWYAPMIDNPNYKGIWKPREIPNPDYFELQKAQLEPIAAVGIEIWTMQDGILFDNILISRDEKLAEEYRVHKWNPKFTVEKEKEKQEEEDSAAGGELSGHQKKVFDALYAVANLPFLGALKPKLLDLILEGEKKPNVTIGVVGAVLIVLLTIVYKLLFGGKKTKPVEKKQNAAPAAPTEKEDETVDAAAAAEKEKSGSENEIEGDNAAPRQRRPRRET